MPARDTAPMVDATGTRRRIQALVFMGHTSAAAAARLGITADDLTYALYQQHVPEELAVRMRRLYDELWNVTPAGPAADRARAFARRRGWVSPLAWDDGTIDDPDTVPDLGAKPAARPVVVAENFAELLSWGHTIDEAAERLGVSRGYIRKLQAAGKAVAA